VSDSRTIGLLLRVYPPAWRARYGEELAALIVESSGGDRVPWRTRADVVLAGGRERLHESGLTGDGAPPGVRACAGSLLALCAWVLFVVAGSGVAKFAEHWQDATPAASRGLPSGAFQGLMVAAAVGSGLVLAGIAATLPSLVVFLRGGGWPLIRRNIVIAVSLTGVAAAAVFPLAAWAHQLTSLQRNGHDLGYGIAFIAWALLVAGCLVAWTRAAVTTARRLSLPAATLRLEAWLASAVTVTMGAMTAATAVWWAALAHTAPWALAGGPAGSTASPLAPQLFAAATLMLVATLIGALGATRSLRALPALAEQHP
jgi:hypothetical protein